MLKIISLVLILASLSPCIAEVAVYKPTDNTGMNKKEQIDGIEKFLATLSTQLNSLEQKIDANGTKIKNLETSLFSIKENDIKKIQEQITAKPNSASSASEKTSESPEELEKIKADILAMKNNDIEQMRLDINALKFSVKNLETIIKVPGK